MIVPGAYLDNACLLLDKSRGKSWLLGGSYLFAKTKGTVGVGSPRVNLSSFRCSDGEAICATHIDDLGDLLLAGVIDTEDEIFYQCGLYHVVLRDVF